MRSEISEYEAVEKAAEKFVKSVAEGNSKYARELFVDEAVLFGYLDGDLEHGSIEQFYDNVDSVAAGDEFKGRIDVLLLEETLAVVRVLEESWGGRIDFTDVLLMLKWMVNGRLLQRLTTKIPKLFKNSILKDPILQLTFFITFNFFS